jgi:hypothetical protein
VIWQYVVFRSNDRDDQFRRAIALAEELGIQIQFDFAHGEPRRTHGDSVASERNRRYAIECI